KRRAGRPRQGSLFDVLGGPDRIDELGDGLLTDFADRNVRVAEVIAEHSGRHVGMQFTDTNYKDALKRLIEKGRVSLPERTVRRAGTLADHLTIIFPQSG